MGSHGMKYRVVHTDSKIEALLFFIIAVMIIFNLLFTVNLNGWLQLIIGIVIAMTILNLIYEKYVTVRLTAEILPKQIRKYKGQDGTVQFKIIQRGWLPILSARIHISAGDDIKFHNDQALKIRNVTESTFMFTVFPRKSTVIEVPFEAKNRGTSKIINTKISIPRLYGFDDILLEQVGHSNHEILVYPDRYALHNQPLKTKIEQGLYLEKNTLFHDPLLANGSRPYERTDSLRDVHWKLSARSGELMTKEYERTTRMSWLFLINLRSEKSFAPPNNIEIIFEKLAYIFGEITKQNIPFKLMANMRTFDQHHFYTIPESSGTLHYRTTLEALARIKTVTYTISFDRFLKFVQQTEKTPTHIIFTGEVDALMVKELQMYIDRGTVIYQLNEHGLEPFKLSALQGGGK